MKANVFIIDSVKRAIVETIYSPTPSDKAEELARGYFCKGEGMPIHTAIPIPSHPNRFGIETPTDFFIHYFA